MVAISPTMNISIQAIDKLQEIMKEEGEEESYLRVIVIPGGNGGIQYMLSLEKEPKEDDLIIQSDPVGILVDLESAPLVEGAELDYVDGLVRSGFVLTNPNFQTSGGCACGQSSGGCGCGQTSGGQTSGGQTSGGCACGKGSCGCGA